MMMSACIINYKSVQHGRNGLLYKETIITNPISSFQNKSELHYGSNQVALMFWDISESDRRVN